MYDMRCSGECSGGGSGECSWQQASQQVTRCDKQARTQCDGVLDTTRPGPAGGWWEPFLRVWLLTNPPTPSVVALDPLRAAPLRLQVCDLAERYAPSPSWFVTIISEVFRLGGEHMDEADADRLMRLIAEQDDSLHASAVEAYLELLDGESGAAGAVALPAGAPRKKLPETILLVGGGRGLVGGGQGEGGGQG
jgi:hypothetical protein